MYTKCFHTVPVTAIDPYFVFTLKKVTGVIRGTVYTKCVYTVPVIATDESFLGR